MNNIIRNILLVFGNDKSLLIMVEFPNEIIYYGSQCEVNHHR